MLEVTKKKLFQFQSILKTSQNLEKIKGIPKTKNIMSGVSKIFKVNEIKKKKRKSRVLRRSYLRRITNRPKKKAFVFKSKAPFTQKVEDILFDHYRKKAKYKYLESRRLKFYNFTISGPYVKIENKSRDSLAVFNSSLSTNNAFATISQGPLKKGKAKPRRFKRTLQVKPSIPTTLNRYRKRKHGLARQKSVQGRVRVIFKKSTASVGMSGTKKTTQYAKEEVFKAASKDLSKLYARYVLVTYSHKLLYMYRRKRLTRNLWYASGGYVIMIKINYRRPHGYVRPRKKRRV